MRAARNGDAAAIRLLLQHGADPALEQKNHVTALMLAAGLGRGLGTFADEFSTEAQQLETVKVLLNQRVDINAANDGRSDRPAFRRAFHGHGGRAACDERRHPLRRATSRAALL